MPVTDMIIINPKRDERSYIVPDFVGPVITGGGETTFRCGRCQTVLLENVAWERVKELAICCAKCGKVNSVPDPGAPAAKDAPSGKA